jgi:hypothetical protein
VHGSLEHYVADAVKTETTLCCGCDDVAGFARQKPHTQRVGRRLALVLFGVTWMISGALMAFNPPPHDFRRAAALPFIGWVTMAFGFYIAIKVLCGNDVADSGKPPRHASGEETNVRDSVKFVLGMVFLPVCGGFAVWDGVRRGLMSLVGIGIATLALGLLAIPLASGVLTWVLHRARR